MRIRQVRPEFWTDETLARLPDSVRLFYIGLWNAADDAGWIEWKPSRLGALIYPYRSARRRETDIAAWGQTLADEGRLQLMNCGCALIPTLPRHQRISGKQSFPVRDNHFSKHGPLSGKQSPLSDSPVTERNVTVGNGSGLKQRVAAHGYRASLPDKASR